MVESGHTMVECTATSRSMGPKRRWMVLPTNHVQHETIEITHGINNWMEVGSIFLRRRRAARGVQWVGDHIRPWLRIPPKWKWPVGFSLSNEIGYQRRKFSVDIWTWEIRPIADKPIGRWYCSLNPTLNRSFHGANVNQGMVFSPNFKFSYDFTKKITGGLE
jgi:hypothetical protein